MRTSFFGLAVGLAIAGLSSGVPSNSNYPYILLSTRSISPDNTCGNSFAGANNSYICDASVNHGGCCSAYGYCGNTTGKTMFVIYSSVTRIFHSELETPWSSRLHSIAEFLHEAKVYLCQSLQYHFSSLAKFFFQIIAEQDAKSSSVLATQKQ